MSPGLTPARPADAQTVGALLREWRERRRLSQLDLSCEAGVSARHLSFLETGRARPSREMILLLAEELQVPLRARNALLLAGGFAPAFAERGLDDPALAGARRAVQLVLSGHEPYPALAIDRGWNLLAANRAVGPLMAGGAAHLRQAPINVLRLTLHPEGLAPRIANLAEWRAHVLERLARQVEATADPALAELAAELAGYPAPSPPAFQDDLGGVAVPFRLRTAAGVLSFLSTTTVFGTPRDITLAELAVEAFFPADEATAEALEALAADR